MSQTIFSMHLSAADMTPASVRLEEEENILATIGHLPEPWVEGAEKVLAITELLENILMQVGETHLSTLLLSQRVNKQFFKTISGSIKLRRALFFEKDPIKKNKTSSTRFEPPKPRLNPFVHYPGDPDIVLTRGRHCSSETCKQVHPGNAKPTNHRGTWWFLLLQAGWVSPLNIDTDDHNASWRKMWTTDPPVEIHQIKCSVLHGSDKKLLEMGPLMDLVKETGVDQRERAGNQLEDYYEAIAPRLMKIPPSKRSTKLHDRELTIQRRWAYTKIILYLAYWMLILWPLGFERAVYVGIATFYLSAKIGFTVLRIRNHRKVVRKAKLDAKLLKAQQEAAEKAAKLAKEKADEELFLDLVRRAAKRHVINRETFKYMRVVYKGWVAEGQPFLKRVK